MRIYISGPMTGYLNYNWPAFEEAAEYYRNKGWEVVSPTEIDEEMGTVIVERLLDGTVWEVKAAPGFDYDAVLANDLEAVAKCDAIYLLPKWEFSNGARLELATALDLGLEVIVGAR
jgi:uncharacterized protein DUF4406